MADIYELRQTFETASRKLKDRALAETDLVAAQQAADTASRAAYERKISATMAYRAYKSEMRILAAERRLAFIALNNAQQDAKTARLATAHPGQETMEHRMQRIINEEHEKNLQLESEGKW